MAKPKKFSYKRTVLQFWRFLSILSCLLIIVGCCIININAFWFMNNANVFFQSMNRLVILLHSLIIIFAELEWPNAVLIWFPWLGVDKSWTFLGVIQIITGSLVLGYDSGIASPSIVGASAFNLVITSGWMILIVGIGYTVLGLVGGVKLKDFRRQGNFSKHFERHEESLSHLSISTSNSFHYARSDV